VVTVQNLRVERLFIGRF